MKATKIVVLLLAVGLMMSLILPAAPSQLLAQEEIDDDSAELQRTLNVSGTGKASAEPDVAVVSLGVDTEAEEAAEALSQNNTQMQALIDSLLEAGIAEEDIQTQVVRLQPRYQQPEREGPSELVGYRAINLVEVRVEEIGSLGEILDAAVQAGGNRIENIRFEVSEPAELVDQAREAAWNDALHRAEQLAGLAGAELGPVLTIAETSRPPQPIVEQSVAAEAAARVPIQPGTQTIEINIQVTWTLQ